MWRFVTTVVCVGVVVAGCGAEKAVHTTNAALSVTTETGPQGGPLVRSEATLRCDGTATATGFLRGTAPRACRVATGGALQKVASADNHRVCTQIYGGPQRARITGKIDGRTIDVTVTRTDGCGVADWDALRALLGDPERGTGATATTPT